MNRKNFGRFGREEQGVVLFLSLVMLLILTILGVSSVQTTSLQERMSRNALDSSLAFQSAEAALFVAESYIENNIDSMATFDTELGDGTYHANNWDEDPIWVGLDWATAHEVTSVELSGVSAQPRYIIEHVKTVVSDQDRLNLDNIGQTTGTGRTQVFRITAMGYGGTQTARAMIQSTYGKKI